MDSAGLRAACGALAWLSPDAEARAAAERDGEDALVRGAMTLSHLMFHLSVVEGVIERGAWAEIERHAAAIDAAVGTACAYGWSADRARAIAAWGQGDRSEALAARVRDVVARAVATRGAPRLPAELCAFAGVA